MTAMVFCHDRRDFTLIEMLVVIAIIAILASLMLPSLTSALDSGRSVLCLNNQRQLGSGHQQYASDNNGRVRAEKEGGAYSFWTLTYAMQGYLPRDSQMDNNLYGLNLLNRPNATVYTCPSFPKPQSSLEPGWQWRTYGTYSCNGYLGGNGSSYSVYPRLFRIPQPSQVFLIGETRLFDAKYIRYNFYEMPTDDLMSLGMPHRQNVSLLFADMHATSTPGDSVPAATDNINGLVNTTAARPPWKGAYRINPPGSPLN